VGLLSDLVSGGAPYSMKDFDRDVRARLGGRKTASGVRVNEESALRYITVYACARVIVETLGSLPLFVFRKRSGGGSDRADDHPNAELLYGMPNDEMTSQSWIETKTGHLVLSGNTYSVITHSPKGRVVDLYPVDWHMVQPGRNQETGKLGYWIQDRGKWDWFPSEKVLHIPGWGFDGIKGYSPIGYAAESIGIGLASTEFAARFFGQGMNMGVVLEHPGELGKEGRDNLKADLMEQGAGMENAWIPLILEEGMKLNRIPMPLKDAQFVELLKLTDTQICGIMRVPPHLVANLDRATFSNIEHQDLAFVKYTMLPYITRFERAMNWKLFTRAEREQGYYVKFNLEALLRGDYKSRQEGLQIQRQNGVINADEWREKEEMNPIEDGSGQVYLANGALQPIGTQNQQRNGGGAGV
jgi:HK97 family phage portal protein